MTELPVDLEARTASWGLITLICVYCGLAGASLGKAIPLLPTIAATLHASPMQVSLVLSIVAAAAVLGAPAAGWLGDRFGDRAALVAGIGLVTLGSLLGATCTLYPVLFAGRCVEGAGFVFMLTGTAALMMRTTRGARQAAGMALFGAAIPGGIGVAEALAGLVPDGQWRIAFWGHAAFLVLGLLAIPLLPPWQGSPRHAQGGLGAFEIYRRIDPVRLAFSLGFLTLAQFGMASLFPAYLRATHGYSQAAAAGYGAIGLMASIVGSIAAGALLARGAGLRLLAGVSLTVVGVAGAAVFAASLGGAFCIGASFVFFVAGGFANGLVLAMLPRLATDPAMRGRAGGLVNQFSNLGILAAPPAAFALFAAAGGSGLVALMLSMAALTLFVMPLAAASRSPSPKDFALDEDDDPRASSRRHDA